MPRRVGVITFAKIRMYVIPNKGGKTAAESSWLDIARVFEIILRGLLNHKVMI